MLAGDQQHLGLGLFTQVASRWHKYCIVRAGRLCTEAYDLSVYIYRFFIVSLILGDILCVDIRI